MNRFRVVAAAVIVVSGLAGSAGAQPPARTFSTVAELDREIRDLESYATLAEGYQAYLEGMLKKAQTKGICVVAVLQRADGRTAPVTDYKFLFESVDDLVGQAIVIGFTQGQALGGTDRQTIERRCATLTAEAAMILGYGIPTVRNSIERIRSVLDRYRVQRAAMTSQPTRTPQAPPPRTAPPPTPPAAPAAPPPPRRGTWMLVKTDEDPEGIASRGPIYGNQWTVSAAGASSTNRNDRGLTHTVEVSGIPDFIQPAQAFDVTLKLSCAKGRSEYCCLDAGLATANITCTPTNRVTLCPAAGPRLPKADLKYSCTLADDPGLKTAGLTPFVGGLGPLANFTYGRTER